MTHRRKSRPFIPVAMMAAAFAAWALSAQPGHAAKCKVLSDNQCQSDGQACSPPSKGTCVTHHSRSEFSCTCDASSSSTAAPVPNIQFNIGIGGGGGEERREGERKSRGDDRKSSRSDDKKGSGSGFGSSGGFGSGGSGGGFGYSR